MTMIRFTYNDGDRSATVTYSPEYGWIMAGDKALLDNIDCQEIEPRTVDVPVLKVPMRQDVPTELPEVGDTYDADPAAPKRCFVCGHAWHNDVCTVMLPGRIPCDCATAVA